MSNSSNTTTEYGLYIPQDGTSSCNASIANATCNYVSGSVNFYTGEVEYAEYGYLVNKNWSIVMTAIFLITTLLHLSLAIWSKRFWLIYTMFLFGLGELLGWGGRLASAEDAKWLPDSGGLFWSDSTSFMVQICCLIISPAFAAAANYLLLKRLAPILGYRYFLIHPISYTVVFIAGDILSLVVQALGGGVASAATTVDGANNGAHIMVAGVFIQMVVMVLYSAVLLSFIYFYATNKPVPYQVQLFNWWPNALRTKKFKKNVGSVYNTNSYPLNSNPGMPTPAGGSPGMEKPSPLYPEGQDRFYDAKEIKGANVLLGLCAFTTLVIFIRSIYRSIELLGGWTGRIIENQQLFNALDGVMMAIVVIAYVVVHPAFWLPRVAKGHSDA